MIKSRPCLCSENGRKACQCVHQSIDRFDRPPLLQRAKLPAMDRTGSPMALAVRPRREFDAGLRSTTTRCLQSNTPSSTSLNPVMILGNNERLRAGKIPGKINVFAVHRMMGFALLALGNPCRGGAVPSFRAMLCFAAWSGDESMNGRLVGSLTFEEIARLSERSVLLLPIGFDE